jgi:glycosyltransferase involved in cell wall biosynthesis
MQGFSVVMSVYANDDPVFFKEAFGSLMSQSNLPSEIIITVDGPVDKKLDTEIKKISQISIVKILRLKTNVGLSEARKKAIELISCKIFAVMDSDDIALPTRFEKQLPLLISGEADVVGGWIEEFDSTPGDLSKVREVPAKYQDILNFCKWRNPINHVTLVFNKEAYDKVGGYCSIRYNEDWDLIVRMLLKGVIVRNIPEVFVNVRAGNSMIARRRAFPQFKRDISLFFSMYRSGFINILILCTNIILRGFLRILPISITVFAYKYFLRR